MKVLVTHIVCIVIGSFKEIIHSITQPNFSPYRVAKEPSFDIAGLVMSSWDDVVSTSL